MLQKITIQLGSGWVFVGFLPGFSGGFTPKPLDYLGRPMCPGIQTLFVVQLITAMITTTTTTVLQPFHR